jgi:hypothetical protein
MLVANRASTEVIDVFIDLNKAKAIMIDRPGMGKVKN